MTPQNRIAAIFMLLIAIVMLSPCYATAQDVASPRRLGIIGLTTSHVIAFTGTINDPKADGVLAKYQVTDAFPGGMADNPSSIGRVDGYTKQLSEQGIAIHDTIEEMLKHVDVVLLESVDGRPHLEQARPVIEAGIPLFIDKPMAGSLADVISIFALAEEYDVPCFSSSSLRYSSGFQKMRNDSPVGKILGCAAYSPCSYEEHHPDLFWYGVHGCEILYTIMGTGCETVTRAQSDTADLVIGQWKDGRIGTFRGIRSGKTGYGATVFGEKGIADGGTYEGYKPLVLEICQFFETGVAPIDSEETIELFAFMTAADQSKRLGGKPVSINDTLQAAYEKAGVKRP